VSERPEQFRIQCFRWRPKNDLILYSVFGRLGIVNGLHPGQFFRAKAGTRQGVCLSAERLKTLAGVPIEWEAQQRLLED